MEYKNAARIYIIQGNAVGGGQSAVCSGIKKCV